MSMFNVGVAAVYTAATITKIAAVHAYRPGDTQTQAVVAAATTVQSVAAATSAVMIAVALVRGLSK